MEGTVQFQGGLDYGSATAPPLAPYLSVTEVVSPCPLELTFTPTRTVVGYGEPYMLVLEARNTSSCPAYRKNMHSALRKKLAMPHTCISRIRYTR